MVETRDQARTRIGPLAELQHADACLAAAIGHVLDEEVVGHLAAARFLIAAVLSVMGVGANEDLLH